MNRFYLKQLKKYISIRQNLISKSHSDAFSKGKRGTFIQTEAVLTNQYKEDAYLRDHLALVVPKQV